MKMTIQRSSLAGALTAASAITPLRGVKPILSYALVTGKADGTLLVEATDQEVGLRYQIAADSCDGDFVICLPCQMLSGLLKECQEETVSIDINETKAILTIGGGCFEVMGQDPTDFPEVIPAEQGVTISLPAGDVAGMIDRTIFSAATEPGRYAINGIYIQCTEGVLEMVATDGRRMAYCRKKGNISGELTEGLIVPVKMMREIRKLCDIAGHDQTLTISFADKKVVAECGPVKLSSLVVEGTYPRYQKVIPDDVDKDIVINAQKFHNALRRVNFLVSADSEVVIFKFSNNHCTMETSSPDKGRASVNVEVGYTGPEVKVGFRPRYLLDVLRVLDTKEEAHNNEVENARKAGGEAPTGEPANRIMLQLKDGSRPSILKQGGEYLYVIMPVNN